jgi:hypothetical protein
MSNQNQKTIVVKLDPHTSFEQHLNYELDKAVFLWGLFKSLVLGALLIVALLGAIGWYTGILNPDSKTWTKINAATADHDAQKAVELHDVPSQEVMNAKQNAEHLRAIGSPWAADAEADYEKAKAKDDAARAALRLRAQQAAAIHKAVKDE